jgi:hypothetical protein
MQIEKEYLNLISNRFSQAFGRFALAVGQLDDEQIWYRPSNYMNSIGILFQHLNGNLNQLICSSIGGESFQRNRDQEFLDTDRKSKEEIMKLIDSLGKRIQNIISNVAPETLLAPKSVLGLDMTVMSVLLAALTHFELHTGQVMMMAKLILGEKYIVTWKPANPGQVKK